MLPFNPDFISPSCTAVKCKSYAEAEINKRDLGRNNFMSLLSLLRGVYIRWLIVHKCANRLAYAKGESNTRVRQMRIFSISLSKMIGFQSVHTSISSEESMPSSKT